MRVQAAPERDAPAFEGAGASPLPLLSGTVRDRTLRLTETLTKSLRPAPAEAHRDGSLACGSAGLAVCHGQLARTRSDPQRADAALAHLEQAIDVLTTQPLTSSLYMGFTGIAWAVELVERLLGTEGEDRNGDIDEALMSLLRRYPEHAPYDLIHGLAGIGVYALARWPRPGAAQCILGVIEELTRRARYDRDGVYWWTSPTWKGPQQERYQPGGVDLGLAHGMAGVIPFLARVHRLGLARQAVRPLLDGAVDWLLAHLVDTAAGPTVPYFVADEVEPGPARSAWCYGDPGVAAALLLASRDAGEPAWAAAATTLALGAANRPPDQTGVVDAGFCHGSAGLSHLFNRMYQLTAEPVLADAARFWAERTLDLCSPAAAGPDGPGLLEGTAGVVLALEAACTAAEPAWDQMLLVSTTATPEEEAR